MRLLTLIFALMALPAFGAPETYRLNPETSIVGFTYQFQGNPAKGRMPIKDADMRLDLDNIPASEVNVTLDASQAKAGVIFATEAMKGPKILNTDRYPTISFRSTQIKGDLQGAQIRGNLTIRDITLPIVLQANLFRQSGTEVGDRNRLIVQLTGKIKRADYGAGGFAAFVEDVITLNIIARIER
ncbi:MAG: YceI family protein [Pseudomonadota bacterium]